MKLQSLFIAFICAVAIIAVGFLAVPAVFAQRVWPGVKLGQHNLGGVSQADLPGLFTKYNEELRAQTVVLNLDNQTAKHTLAELGVSINTQKTLAGIGSNNWSNLINNYTLRPSLTVDTNKLNEVMAQTFAAQINLPQNANLAFGVTGQLELIPAKQGEGIDQVSLERDILNRAATARWREPIELATVTTAASIQNNEVGDARSFAETLLRDGLTLTYGEKTWPVKAYTTKRLLTFVSRPASTDPPNLILGVAFDEAGLKDYLAKTIAPDIDQEAQNARFVRSGDRVEQFALPQDGRKLDIDPSVAVINDSLARNLTSTALAVSVTEPSIKESADIVALGLNDLLATGVSDFSGSPVNRIHNINIGTARYHGLLIAPNQEFSFDEALGPVDGEHGFKPELVIKQNVTTPEFGGGLCQVSTTAFRAAVEAGLKITQRRNHAYVVRYYGKPGFDATIYPPYTDLRFINNTPGYILIQARIEGKKVIFEFWGTKDGREVTVTGPTTYDWQPDGSVKATLKQQVVKTGETIIDDTFYSKYRSPSLFPHAVSADDPQAQSASAPAATAAPATTPVPTNDKSTPTKSTPTPTPAAAPAPTDET
ncbi:MAG: VanW family protein [bacterium]|nr:VanW family protein [bacterium]